LWLMPNTGGLGKIDRQVFTFATGPLFYEKSLIQFGVERNYYEVGPYWSAYKSKCRYISASAIHLQNPSANRKQALIFFQI